MLGLKWAETCWDLLLIGLPRFGSQICWRCRVEAWGSDWPKQWTMGSTSGASTGKILGTCWAWNRGDILGDMMILWYLLERCWLRLNTYILRCIFVLWWRNLNQFLANPQTKWKPSQSLKTAPFNTCLVHSSRDGSPRNVSFPSGRLHSKRNISNWWKWHSPKLPWLKKKPLIQQVHSSLYVSLRTIRWLS